MAGAAHAGWGSTRLCTTPVSSSSCLTLVLVVGRSPLRLGLSSLPSLGRTERRWSWGRSRIKRAAQPEFRLEGTKPKVHKFQGSFSVNPRSFRAAATPAQTRSFLLLRADYLALMPK